MNPPPTSSDEEFSDEECSDSDYDEFLAQSREVLAHSRREREEMERKDRAREAADRLFVATLHYSELIEEIIDSRRHLVHLFVSEKVTNSNFIFGQILALDTEAEDLFGGTYEDCRDCKFPGDFDLQILERLEKQPLEEYSKRT